MTLSQDPFFLVAALFWATASPIEIRPPRICGLAICFGACATNRRLLGESIREWLNAAATRPPLFSTGQSNNSETFHALLFNL